MARLLEVAALGAAYGATRVLRVPGDLPGPVLDIAMNRDYLWLGTPQGLSRLRRRGDGGLP